MDRARKVQDKIAQLQKTFECPICLELMKNPVSTKCDHKFCRHCLLSAVGKKLTAPCPLCKETFTKRSLQLLPRWNELVTTIGKMVTAYQQDTGEHFSPPRGPPLPASQSSQRVKAKQRRRLARCRRKTNFDEVEGPSQHGDTGKKRKAEEEVTIYIEDAEGHGEESRSQLALKSNINISPAFALGAPSKRRKPSERKNTLGNENLPPGPTPEDVVAYLTHASFTQKSANSAENATEITAKSKCAAIISRPDGSKLTIAVPREMLNQKDGKSKKVKSAQSKSRNTRQTKKKAPITIDDTDQDVNIDLTMSDACAIQNTNQATAFEAEETIAERIKRNSTGRKAGGKGGEIAFSDPRKPSLKPNTEDQPSEQQKVGEAIQEIPTRDLKKTDNNLKKHVQTSRLCRPKSNALNGSSIVNRRSKKSSRDADLADYLVTATATELCGVSQPVSGENCNEAAERANITSNDEKKTSEMHNIDKVTTETVDQEAECEPGTKTKVEKWLAVASDSVSPLLSDTSKTLALVTEGVDCDSVPSQAVGHELEICLERIAEDVESADEKDAANCEGDTQPDAAASAAYDDSDDDDADAELLVRTDEDDCEEGSTCPEDGEEEVDQNDDGYLGNSEVDNNDIVFGHHDTEDAAYNSIDTSQETISTAHGRKNGRIFKTKLQTQSQPSEKTKYKLFGTPNSDDPYSFKPSQKTPQNKPKKGRRARAKQRQRKQLEMIEIRDEIPTDLTAEVPKENKPNKKKQRAKQAQQTGSKMNRKKLQVENSEKASQQLGALIDKISEAEDFELMFSQQYRDMVSSAKKKQKLQRQNLPPDVGVNKSGVASKSAKETASQSENPIPDTAQSTGQKLQSVLSCGKSSVIKKRVTISCVTEEDKGAVSGDRRRSAPATRHPPPARAVSNSGEVTPETGKTLKNLSQAAEHHPTVILETPQIGALTKPVCKIQRNQNLENVEKKRPLSKDNVVWDEELVTGETNTEVAIPILDTREAWKSARKMSMELGPRTKKLQMVESQKPAKATLAIGRKKPARAVPLDTSTEDEVIIQEVMSEVRGHTKVTSPGDKDKQKSGHDSSDTESLDSPRSPQQFESPNLSIQPENIKRRLLQESCSMQDSECDSPRVNGTSSQYSRFHSQHAAKTDGEEKTSSRKNKKGTCNPDLHASPANHGQVLDDDVTSRSSPEINAKSTLNANTLCADNTPDNTLSDDVQEIEEQATETDNFRHAQDVGGPEEGKVESSTSSSSVRRSGRRTLFSLFQII